jgi:hypothetical protein
MAWSVEPPYRFLLSPQCVAIHVIPILADILVRLSSNPESRLTRFNLFFWQDHFYRRPSNVQNQESYPPLLSKSCSFTMVQFRYDRFK